MTTSPTGGAHPSAAVYGSDLIVDLLASLGIEYIALNPGASFRGLHDSLVNFRVPGAPQIITCTHEEIAVAMAHGYAKVGGRPMATALHNLVGLQHGTMAIFNAWCDRAPILVLGGTGPMDATQRRPHIDWVHTALVQGNQVRDYVKLDDQPMSVAAFPESMLRAYKVATTQPQGPVYVCFDVDHQEQRLAAPITVPDVARYRAPVAPPANADQIKEAVELLVGAEWPVIVVEHLNRDPASHRALVELAEALGAGVVDRGGSACFPSTHPLDLSMALEAGLKDADVVLGLAVTDLGGVTPVVPHERGLNPTAVPADAKVVHITMGDYLVHSWVSDYEKLPAVDVLIGADVNLALPDLLEACRRELGRYPGSADRVSRRRVRVEALHQQAVERAAARLKQDFALAPISAARLYHELWQRVKGTPWAMNRLVRPFMDVAPENSFTGGGGGAGLGFSFPAALGGRLAMKDADRMCINVSGDGDFLMVSGGLWTAAHYNIPILQIIFDNRSYYQDEGHQTYMARDRERSLENLGNGIFLNEPATDFAGLARSFGVEGFGPAGDPDALGAVLDAAIHVVRDEKRPVLVDVLTQKR